MSQKIYLSSEFVIESCCNCGAVFAMMRDFSERRQRDHTSFYCPNGHAQHYTAKSKAEKLQEQLKHCRLDRDFWQEGHYVEQEKRKEVERSRSSFKGVITKMRKKD